MKLLLRPLNDEIKSMYHDDALENNNSNRVSRGDAGLDLYCPGDLTILPNETAKIDFKIQCEGLSDTDSRNVCYYLYPRSSISKTPLRLANSVGIIDAGYRGNLMAVVDNISDEPYQIQRGQRLFQICGRYLEPIHLTLVEELSNSERGNGGFGSTGS
jgi:dUTP pyrophosphatase|tara:strand:+ start:798 stop:1271 length:474 start_codon:yes stop_codon:yes gene_type:complete